MTRALSPQATRFLRLEPGTSAKERASLNEAAALILRGDPVIVPTETVYGLAGDAMSDAAVKAIYSAKNRPQNNPLICHVSDLAMAKRFAQFSPLALKLANHFWPGPLTLVLPLNDASSLSSLVTAGHETVAIRCPAAPAFQRLISMVDRPLAAPSANRSGRVSPVTADQAAASLLGAVSLALDAGQTSYGLESSIVKLDDTSVTILRPGPITGDDIAQVTGKIPDAPVITTNKPTAPGQLTSHYAPYKPVYLNQPSKRPTGIYIGFGHGQGAGKADISLSDRGDLSEAAHALYDALHRADTLPGSHIDIAPIPNEGIGIAINDRLRRAASPRPKSAETGTNG